MQRFLAFVPGPAGPRAVAGALVVAFTVAGCGSNESCAVTDSCPNQAPDVTILSPPDGGTSVVGAAVTFSGEATDADDGPITGDDLVWTSDLDGPIGTGAEFSRSDLSGGFHEITLTATDSEGASGTATVTFGVGGAPQVEILGPDEQSNGAPHTVTVGTTVTFTGSAIDVEDGSIDGAALVWTSNVDGLLGTGVSFEDDALTAGMHTVTLTATDSDDNEATATVLVIVKPPAATGYQVHVRTSEGVEMTPTQRQAVDQAAAKLETVITGDVQDITAFQFAGGSCGGAAVPLLESIDDVVIYLEFVPIDGPGGTVARAGPCLTRQLSGTITAFSLLGGIRFDTADLQRAEDDGAMADVILHEMMHVLGFGIFWDDPSNDPNDENFPFEFLEQPSDSSHAEHTPGMTDTHFIGPEATARFLAVGGELFTGGEIVPVENDTARFNPGSLDGHWRESVFDDELMSTQFVAADNPLSVVTVGQFEDLGYTVDFGAADPYMLPVMAIVTGPQVTGSAIDLSGDIWRGSLHAVDSDGSQQRIR